MYFRTLKDLSLLEITHPLIDNLFYIYQNPAYHAEGNMFEHVMKWC